MRLLGQTVVLEFDEIVAFSKDLGVHAGEMLGFVVFPPEQVLVDFGAKAGGGADEAFAEPAEQVVVDPRSVVVAFQGRDAGELAEVAVTLQILGEKEEVVAVFFFSTGSVLISVRGNIRFEPDQGFDPLIGALHVELHDPEHDAMIGDGEGFHAELFGSFDHVRDTIGPVQQAVLGVVMDVAEGSRHGQSEGG